MLRIPRSVGILASLILLLGATEVFAWEISLRGANSWTYLRYGYIGEGGFFGRFNQDNRPGAIVPPEGSYASVNGWFGTQVGELVSGSDAGVSSFVTTLLPTIKVIPALQFQGSYRVGGGVTDLYPGISNSSGSGEWSSWSVTLGLPWGNLFFGKKAFLAGCGLQYDGSGNRSEEYIELSTHQGPMVFGIGFYPWKPSSGTYYNLSDGNSFRYDVMAWITLLGPSFQTGLGSRLVSYHEGPEGQRFQLLREQFSPRDTDLSEGFVYVKYNNGRVFFNAEADWWYQSTRYGKSLSGTSINGLPDPPAQLGGASLFAPSYVESWRYMVETGAYSGPFAFSLLYAWLPGPDRRHGILIDRQPVEVDPDPSRGVALRSGFGYALRQRVFWSPDRGNATVFRPYSLLLCNAYGAGVNAVDYAGSGYLTDASVWAARIDYALAANLNTYLTFVHARRVSHGYGWGFIRPSESGTNDLGAFGGFATSGASGRVEYVRNGDYNSPSPAIPDNDLGWEVNVGCDWQLLEFWKLQMMFAYWQPGRWFNFACVDRSMPNWANVVGWNGVPLQWGINPDRSLPAVYGMSMGTTIWF